MKDIFGSSWVAILVATIAFYMVGFLIFGVLFSEQWLELAGMTEADAMARNEELGAMMYVWGLALTLAQVLGLAWVMNHVGASEIGTSLKVGATIAILFALPILGYNWLYEARPAAAVGIDIGHLLIGYMLSCAILGAFRSRD